MALLKKTSHIVILLLAVFGAIVLWHAHTQHGGVGSLMPSGFSNGLGTK